jgi:nitrogen regulatory protein P-II 2
MLTTRLCLLTIVAEGVLRDRLLGELRAVGASGFTAAEVQGEGSRQRRVSQFMGPNVKIEVVIGRDKADRLLEILSIDYFPQYAVIAYLSEVEVVRGEKYV